MTTIEEAQQQSAINYLASKGALSKLGQRIPVIGRDPRVTLALNEAIVHRRNTVKSTLSTKVSSLVSSFIK